MLRHESDVRLRHMLDHAREAVAMARGRTPGRLDTDRQLNLALVRLLEIVGEAAGRLPSDERRLRPDIPWPEIVGLRNRLIHGYDSVDFDILWQVITDDLPPLITASEEALKAWYGKENASTRLEDHSFETRQRESRKEQGNERNVPLRFARSKRGHHEHLRQEERL